MNHKHFKPLAPFYLASLSLLATGFLFNAVSNPLEIIFLSWVCISGIYLVYRLNDFIDQTDEFTFSIKEFLSDRMRRFFVLQMVFFVIPTSIHYLSYMRFFILFIAAILGFLYSYQLVLGTHKLRLKHLFLVKNILIGLGWGALVLVGSNQLDSLSMIYFVFCSVQVFIGSTIRDIGDLDSDQRFGVASMPVTWGVSTTLKVLTAVNLGCLLFSNILWASDMGVRLMLIPLFVTCLWRFIVIERVMHSQDLRWQQKWNLWTCNVIFLGALLVWFYQR